MTPINWQLRQVCAAREIWTAAALHRLIARRTGLHVNPQTVQAWFRRRPKRLDLRTLEIILNALGCRIDEIAVFRPPANDREARAVAIPPARGARATATSGLRPHRPGLAATRHARPPARAGGPASGCAPVPGAGDPSPERA